MSQAAAAQTTTNETRAPIPAPEIRADTNAERPAVPPPEHAQPAIVPPETTTPTIPTPPVALADNPRPSLVEITKPAANEVHGDKNLVIEQLLARFIGDRLPKGAANGLSIEFVAVPSSVVTADGQNQHDIKLVFSGGNLNDAKKAQSLATMLRGAMHEHPAFEGMSFGGADQPIEHSMQCQILALEPERYEQLLKPQPRKYVTFIPEPDEPSKTAGHHCTGAGCKSCGPKVDQPKPDTRVEMPPASHEPLKQVANGVAH